MKALKKPSLARILADTISADLRAGTWRDTLPGLRSLASHYGTSLRTSTDAIGLLEKDGILSPASPGKARRILLPRKAKRQSRKKQHTLLIIHNSAFPLSSEHASILSSIQAHWEQVRGSAVRVPLDYMHLQSPEKRLPEIIRRHSADAALLLNTGKNITSACATHLPCFQLGGDSIQSSNISHFGTSYTREIENYTRQLVSYGHRRILAPVLNTGSQSICLKGLRAGYGDTPPPSDLEDLVPVITSTQPQAWQAFWKEKLSTLEPSAVIVMKDTNLLSLYGFCLQAGIRIPWDLSIILYSYNPKLEWLSPRPTMGSFPQEKFLTIFKKWVRTGYQTIPSTTLPLHHHWGESVGRIS